MITRNFSGSELYNLLGQYEWNDLMEWCEARDCTCEVKSFPVESDPTKHEMKLEVGFPNHEVAMLFKLTWK